ncbi:carbonic anhydrase 2 [Selaginella moellendorffii]|uniref:carbonic anhydrase 2 n=1 Tax=Selaginella moellendorffii TaxID=88036 RepID=UPI000D1C96D7|nr:carbonic anhydrase 2 [Selaginella moellendorffii]|eukprot:XP_024522634.1 carbonic anhydrase 2 [Selaginella moellendorffii]
MVLLPQRARVSRRVKTPLGACVCRAHPKYEEKMIRAPFPGGLGSTFCSVICFGKCAAGRHTSLCQAYQNTFTPTERVKQRIQHGFEKFKQETFLRQPKLFREVAVKQTPKFMVIACSDSRVCPTTVLGFRPGEAFVVRNIANMVPPPEQAMIYPGTSAAIEYAVMVLKVESIMVIGHSRCGGILALMTQKENVKRSVFVEDWIQIGLAARTAALKAAADKDLEQQCTMCEKESINLSLSNLLAFPFVHDAVMNGNLTLHGGYYNFVEGSFEYWLYGADGKTGAHSRF